MKSKFSMSMLETDSGDLLTLEKEIEQELVRFYERLYGDTSGHQFLLKICNGVALRRIGKLGLKDLLI